MLRNVRLYFRYIQMHILAELEYRGWWMSLLRAMLVSVAELVPTYLMFHRMGNVGEWSMEQILLIYSIALTSFGIAESFCNGLSTLPWAQLRTGGFDRFLLRPKSLILQTIGSSFYLLRLARVIVGCIVLGWALTKLNIPMTLLNLTILSFAILGGAAMYAGVLLMSTGIAFFTIKALDWIYIFTYASYEVTKIPRNYMPNWIVTTFTFVLPLLVIAYYPAAAICGWGATPLWTGFLALPSGLIFLLLSRYIWQFGVRHYKSTGS